MQPHDGIRDELARTVIGHLATTLDALDADPAIGQLRFRRQDVGGIGVLAERQDGGVFEEEQLIGNRAGLALFDQLPLQLETIGVRNNPQPPNFNDPIHRQAPCAR